MVETYKVLGQAAPSATTETDLYTVPTGKYSVISNLIVVNRGTDEGTVRVNIAVGGASTADKQYVVYDEVVYPNTSVPFCKGATLGEGDVLRVYASSDYFSFNLFGVEVEE